jgi:hypothetical protein
MRPVLHTAPYRPARSCRRATLASDVILGTAEPVTPQPIGGDRRSAAAGMTNPAGQIPVTYGRDAGTAVLSP